MEKQENDYMTLEQVEAEFGIAQRTLYRNIKEGKLPAYKPFGKLFVKRKDLITIFQRSKVKSA